MTDAPEPSVSICRTGPSPPSLGCLPHMFADHVRARPDATAVVHRERSMTYRELARAADQLAGRLRSLGVTADTCVGLFAEPSPELMVGVWGILCAGGTYLPLSPDYPEERLRYMMADSDAPIVLTQRRLVDRLTETAPKETTIVLLDEPTGDSPPTPTRPEVGSHDLAYVLYTSGSTGRPKGVMVEHRAIVSQLRWLRACSYLGPGVRILQKTPISFDAAQWEVLAPACGATVVMGDAGLHRDPGRVIDKIVEHDVDTLQAVPTLLQALLTTELLPTCRSLRAVFSGGEALPRGVARKVLAALPQAFLVNLYGPTECTINSTAYRVDPDELDSGPGTVPIGFPVDNTSCFVLDEDQAPQGINEVGELHIGGHQLARGYRGRPEETAERFVPSPFVPTERLYRTGDLAYWDADGALHFAGRNDNQIKLRGYRVELDEIAAAIMEHHWVRHAAAVAPDNPRTGSADLVAAVDLNPREATLMDQGRHGQHHQSKTDRRQVTAQLAQAGLRTPSELAGCSSLALPGREPSLTQRRAVFGRKTYRFYEGGQVTLADLLVLVSPPSASGPAEDLEQISLDDLARLLRWIGQFHSSGRLLPKYAYASPGALYAAQLYLELDGVAGLDSGAYYYHPADHRLYHVAPALTGKDLGRPPRRTSPHMHLHLVGRRAAIESVYSTNVREVLEFEAGHLIGEIDHRLAAHGLGVQALDFQESVGDPLTVAGDEYLGSFAVRPRGESAALGSSVELFIQAHAGKIDGLAEGLYRPTDSGLERVCDELVRERDVIAINQQVYRRASFGVAAVSRSERAWLDYIGPGARLHQLQLNGRQLGLMSSGYSSKSGHPMAAARRLDHILEENGVASGPSYFAVGGKVSPEQIRSEGMNEDSVHMQGPAEMIKEDLARLLPDYMMPNRVVIFDRLPLLSNGKIDRRALLQCDEVTAERSRRPILQPATKHERHLAQLWSALLSYDDVSLDDEFFERGGNSLVAVELMDRIDHEFGVQLPLQTVFETPRLGDLAGRIGDESLAGSRRTVLLRDGHEQTPVFCWPGLGGYPMNLRPLARSARIGGRPFYGVQAYGINEGETPYPTTEQTAAADLAEIRGIQQEGPYTLWGYSFGARVAFEAAWQLERAGELVGQLVLICPGNPEVVLPDRHRSISATGARRAHYDNPHYLAILLSVFTSTISGAETERCLDTVDGENSFVSFVHDLFPSLDKARIRRIIRVVEQTYEFEYTFDELAGRRLRAPVTVVKTAGDDHSFIDHSSGYSEMPPTVIELDNGHYEVLKAGGVEDLATAIGGVLP